MTAWLSFVKVGGFTSSFTLAECESFEHYVFTSFNHHGVFLEWNIVQKRCYVPLMQRLYRSGVTFFYCRDYHATVEAGK